MVKIKENIIRKLLKNNITKHIVYILSYKSFNKILFLVLVILISRKLGVEGLGSYGYLLALIGILFPIANLCETVLVRDIIQKRKNIEQLWGDSILFNFFTHSTIYLVILILSKIINFPPELKISIYLTGILLFLDIFLRNAIAIFTAYRKIKIISLSNIISDSLIIIFSIIFLYQNKGITYIIIAFIIGRFIKTLILNIKLIKYFKKPKWNIKTETFIRWIKQGTYFTLQSSLSKNLFRINLIIITSISGLYIAGLYEASSTIIESILEFLLIIFSLVIYPHYIICNKSSLKALENHYKNFRRNIIIGGIVFGSIFFFLAKEVIVTFYGEEFLKIVPVFQIFLVTIVILALNNNNRTFLNSIKKERIGFLFSLVMFLTNLTLSLIIIKPYGLKGIAITTTISSLIYLILSNLYIQNQIKKLKIKK